MSRHVVRSMIPSAVLALVMLMMVAFPASGLASGARVGAMAWRVSGRISRAGFTSLSCPSIKLCVAVDAGGHIFASGNPAAGSGSWTSAAVTSSSGQAADFVGISCGSTRLCVAADTVGDVVSSATPSDPSSWSVAHVDASTTGIPGPIFGGVACPSAELCVAIDDAGNVLTSTSPAIASASWELAHVDDGTTYECYHYGYTGSTCQPALTAISCASSRSCTVIDSAGNVLSSTEPAGGTAAWNGPSSVTTPMTASFTALACPSVRFCLATMNGSSGIFRGNAAGIGSSPAASPDPNGTVSGVWCQSLTLCFASDENYLYESFDPGETSESWGLAYAEPAATRGGYITSVSCPSAKLCVATDGRGYVLLGRPGPNAAQLKSTLLRELILRGPQARLSAVVRADGYQYSVHGAVGRLRIAWYALRRSLPLRTAGLIGKGELTSATAARRHLRLILTRAGRRLLARSTTARLLVVASFTADDHVSASVTKQIRLTG